MLYRVHDIYAVDLLDIRVVFVDVDDKPGTGISFDVAGVADVKTIKDDKYCNEDETAS